MKKNNTAIVAALCGAALAACAQTEDHASTGEGLMEFNRQTANLRIENCMREAVVDLKEGSVNTAFAEGTATPKMLVAQLDEPGSGNSVRHNSYIIHAQIGSQLAVISEMNGKLEKQSQRPASSELEKTLLATAQSCLRAG